MKTIERIRQMVLRMKAEAPTWGFPEDEITISPEGVYNVSAACEKLLAYAEAVNCQGLPDEEEQLQEVLRELESIKPAVVQALEDGVEAFARGQDVSWNLHEQIDSFCTPGRRPRRPEKQFLM